MRAEVSTPPRVSVDENIVERLYTPLDRIDTTNLARHLVAYTPTNSEIDRLFERSRLEIGTVTTLDVIKRVISANPDTFHAFASRVRHRVEDPQGEGFIAWLPLTEAGRRAMLDGTFNAADPASEHVAGQHDAPAAIYIWGLYAPGRLAVGFAWAFQRWSTPLYRNADIYARAVTPSGRRFVHRVGFAAASAQDGPAADDLFVFRRQPLDERPVYDSHPNASKQYTVTVVRSHDDLGKVMAIRSSVYMAEQVCPYDEEFDGNDFAATHLLGYVAGEPAASIRIRCFADFAKVERLAVRHPYRKSRLALVMIRAAKELCRMKGYTRIYGQAQKRLVNMWSRSGARPIPDAPEITFSDFDYVQMLLETDAHPDAVTLASDPFKIIRPEGQWHQEGILEKSSARPATRPSVDHPTIHAERSNRRTA